MTARGTVSELLQAVLVVRVRGPAGTVIRVDAVLDTGYSGSLTLPSWAVEHLGLLQAPLNYTEVELADGSSRSFDTYLAQIEWGGTWRDVIVWVVGMDAIDALVGMELLAGHRLSVDVEAGESVEVVPLS